ncbi:MAG TPA: hypothetical protein VLK33_14240 [Terriglobales bacterium]|nr:hypothetical protein [Terriglobales bacterium]
MSASYTLSVLVFQGLNPLWLVLVVSVIVGLLMVLVFRYTSNQKAIRRAKDALKAHLLAVRLFQDQLPVVIRAYGKILLGTVSYLRLTFTPLLIAIVPMTFLIIQMDRYLGAMPLQPMQSFLLEAKSNTAESLDQIELRLPDGLMASAPPVHVSKENLIVWRLQAQRTGEYLVGIESGGQTVEKQIVVSPMMEKLSPMKLQGNLWSRILSSAEPALPDSSTLQSISVYYPERNIPFLGIEWNWIVLFFIVSLISGFVFKSALGIQI